MYTRIISFCFLIFALIPQSCNTGMYDGQCSMNSSPILYTLTTNTDRSTKTHKSTWKQKFVKHKTLKKNKKANQNATATSSTLIDLSGWLLQTVVDNKFKQLNPIGFESDYFYTQNRGYVLKVNGNWPTTKNSKFPRTEFRESLNGKPIDWSMTSGRHMLNVSIRIDTSERKIITQIKSNPSTSGAVIKVWAENNKIWGQCGPHGGQKFVLTNNYNKEILNYSIDVENGVATFVMDSKTFECKSTIQSNYFKVGNYLQTVGNITSQITIFDLSTNRI